MATTWNPLDKHAYVTLSGGNLIATNTASMGRKGVRATDSKNSGKHYFEITITDLNAIVGVGLALAGWDLQDTIGGDNDKGWSAETNGGFFADYSTYNLGFPGVLEGTIYSIAVDLDTGKIWVAIDGTWYNSGDPTNGANPTYSGSSLIGATVYPAAVLINDQITANFGGTAYAYSIPSGFASWEPPESSPYSRGIDESLVIGDAATSNCANLVEDELSLSEVTSERHLDLLEEVVELFDQSGSGNLYYDMVSDGIELNGLSLWQLGLLIQDEFKNEDEALEWLKTVWIVEALICADLAKGDINKVIVDTFFLYDTLKHGWNFTVPETVGLADSVLNLLGLMIDEWLTIKDSQVNNWDGQEIMAETIALNSLPVLIQSSKQTIADTLAIADSPSWRLMLAILDVMSFTDLSKAVRKSQHTAAETLALTDEARRGFENLVESVLSAIDASSVIGAFAKSLAESLDLADAPSFITRVAGSVNESLVFSETASSAGKLYNIIRESLALNVLMELDGEIWECFVLNTPHFHPSIYSGYDFNSFCVFEGRAFGANEKGVYELTGSTDAGDTIHTGIIMKETDFGAPNQKRFRRGYFGVSGSSPVLILETESGQRQAYSIDTKGKTVASHELKSKSWTLSIADFQTLESAILIPVVLSR